MLINFRFKNCRSFYKETNFSMEAVKNLEFKETNTFTVDENLMNKGENELLKAAAIFGSNASGKSNVLKALTYMKNVIAYSASQMPIVKDNQPFIFYEGAEKEPSEYEVELIQNGTYYKYGFVIKNGLIIKESLYKRKERLTPVFIRDEKNIKLYGADKKMGKIIKINSSSLFLSFGVNLNLEIKNSLLDVIEWFQNLMIVFEGNANSLDIYTMDNDKYKEQALKILEMAEIGIKDMSVRKGMVENADLYNIDLETLFNVYDKDKNVSNKKSVKLLQNEGFNSEGTKKLLLYLGEVLKALDKGFVIVIDDVDLGLDFQIAKYIINVFNTIDKNPNNAQLICVANNVLLMDQNLRRDQIYIASKNIYGESELSSLIEFKNVRKEALFSKKYLAGIYVNIPHIDE